MAEVLDIAIIGPGKVGATLGVLAGRAGRSVVFGARDPDRARGALSRLSAECEVVLPADAAGRAGLVLLTVTDEAIEPLCDQLSAEKAFSPGAIVAHCSGALDSEVLASARRRLGCHIGSMHPLQTFPSVQQALAAFGLGRTYCFCEGDDRAVAALEDLARAIDARAVRIEPAGKALYHASAVMACNYLPVLMDCAQELAQLAGIDRQDALSALSPLMKATADNISTLGPAGALTGPVARGQTETVVRHLDALAGGDPGVGDLYRAAGLRAVGLALRKGTIDGAKADELRALLQRGRNTHVREDN